MLDELGVDLMKLLIDFASLRLRREIDEKSKLTAEPSPERALPVPGPVCILEPSVEGERETESKWNDAFTE